MSEKWLHRGLFCISLVISKVDRCVRVQQQRAGGLCWKIGRRGVRETAWFNVGHLQYRCLQLPQVRWKSRLSAGLLGSQNFSSECTHQRSLPSAVIRNLGIPEAVPQLLTQQSGNSEASGAPDSRITLPWLHPVHSTHEAAGDFI